MTHEGCWDVRAPLLANRKVGLHRIEYHRPDLFPPSEN